MKCDNCGKEMTLEGFSIIGYRLQFTAGSFNTDAEFIQKQLGKYELGREYNFCLECMLDSFFYPNQSVIKRRINV